MNHDKFWRKYAPPSSQWIWRSPLLSSLSAPVPGWVVEVLIDAVEALESAVRKKRGPATVQAIRAEAGRGAQSDTFALALAIDLLRAELANKKPGPMPRARAKGKAGRPAHWAPIYEAILSSLKRGAELLKSQGKPVTNVTALEAALRLENISPPLSERDIKRYARRFAKRVPDARRALQK